MDKIAALTAYLKLREQLDDETSLIKLGHPIHLPRTETPIDDPEKQKQMEDIKRQVENYLAGNIELLEVSPNWATETTTSVKPSSNKTNDVKPSSSKATNASKPSLNKADDVIPIPNLNEPTDGKLNWNWAAINHRSGPRLPDECQRAEYYDRMSSRPQLYLQTYSPIKWIESPSPIVKLVKGEDVFLDIDVETLTTYLISKAYRMDNYIDINILNNPSEHEVILDEFDEIPAARVIYTTERNTLDNVKFVSRCEVPEHCQLPYLYIPDYKMTVSGVVAILRFLLKFCMRKAELQDDLGAYYRYFKYKALLGFREGCLFACAETSIWTKFCEMDAGKRMHLDVLEQFLDPRPRASIGPFELPVDLLRFEHHLDAPVRMHNIQKRVQQMAKAKVHSNDSKDNSQETYYANTRCSLLHEFAEGGEFLLSDLILYPSIKLCIDVFDESILKEHVPLVMAWFKRVTSISDLPENSNYVYADLVDRTTLPVKCSSQVVVPEITKSTLYVSDPQRDKTKRGDLTKEEYIKPLLDELSQLRSCVTGKQCFFSPEEVPQALVPRFKKIDWSKIPELAHPGGDIPITRVERKTQQLENMVQMVLDVHYKESQKQGHDNLHIVDFCSGGGHMGILLAWLLPKSHIYLVENKEESIKRAIRRVEGLGLQNVSFYLCNLTRFIGKFDIGTALHACGSSTDLVLLKCETHNASFVVSPCCYGAIDQKPNITYPRSEQFSQCLSNLQEKWMAKGKSARPWYKILCHAADRAHIDKTTIPEKYELGKIAMCYVDTDRTQHFEELQMKYHIWKNQMEPATASPKNHILTGFCKGYFQTENHKKSEKYQKERQEYLLEFYSRRGLDVSNVENGIYVWKGQIDFQRD